MNTHEFLELLLPTAGYIFTAALAGKGWDNRPHTSLDSAIEHINWLNYSGQNAYYAMATYERDRVWNAAADNGKGKWQSRTQDNTLQIKSFFLDLDVDPQDPLKFASKQDALTQLQAFTHKLALPRPMLVDSGGGIHVYWPLAHAVATSQWRVVADQLKAICVSERFNADRSLTADQARVLRPIGTWNYKRTPALVHLLSPGAPVDFDDFRQRLQAFADSNGIVAAAPRHTAAYASAASAAIAGIPAALTQLDNLGATNDPLNFDRVLYACEQLQVQVETRGRDTGEQLWRASLGIVKFCEPQEPAWRAVSDGHPQFSEQATLAKLANWHTGPTACSHFHSLNPSTCEKCPHWTKITSPAVLGHIPIVSAAPEMVVVSDNGSQVTIQLPDPPTGYSRRKHDNAIVLQTEDGDGTPVYEVVCPYDFYPLALRAQTGSDAQVDERSMWRAHLPLERGCARATRDIDVPNQLLADTKSLAKHLLAKGLILNGEQIRMTQHFMSAYLQKLANDAGREKLYDRLGWHDDHRTFVLGDKVLHRDGSVQLHTPSKAIRNTTRDGLRTNGTLAGWQAAMQFYNRPGYEGHRFFVYAALGAPIFHMNDTGNKGVLLTASGESGRGKTTCLKACGSLWGEPEALIMNGNRDGSTVNALYATIGTVHSLPFLWDDITERDSDELRRFLLNISQGQGKRRMTSDSVQSDRMDTWETMGLSTANTDDISRILASGRDVSPHLMRLISVEFALIDQGVEAKIRADEFLRQLKANYGHVGPALMKVLVTQYEVIRKGYIKNVAQVDRMLGSANASAERYWSAAVAAAYTGAQIATRMGLINFPVEADLQWMVSHLGAQRDSIAESHMEPLEQLTAFLNANLRGTMVVSARASSNLDNVVHRPTDELIIRNELDAGVIYISRAAIMAYCAASRMAFKPFEAALEGQRVVLQRNAQKVLGADTVFAAGQTRCWKVDLTKLGGIQLPPAVAASAQASNVIPLAAGARK